MSSNEALSAFMKIISDIEVSGYILFEKKLRSLLSCIAYYDIFKNVVESAKEGFDYNNEFTSAVKINGESHRITLPVSSKKKAMLVLCFLMDFDDGKLDLGEFVNLFYNDGQGDSFKSFVNGIIVPFKNAMLELVLNNGAEQEVEGELLERKIEFSAKGLENEINYIVDSLTEKITAMHISDSTRGDILSVVTGFKIALSMRDATLIKSFFSGIKTILRGQKSCTDDLAKAENLINLYIVSK